MSIHLPKKFPPGSASFGTALSPESGPMAIPEKPAKERWIALAIFALSLLYLFLFRKTTSIDPDEGIILQGAERILRGEVLYRDFFSYFTPGSYYLLALLFKIFGSSMLVARTALAIYGALFSVFTYVMARRVCSRWAALAAAYLVTLTCLPWRFLALHNWDSTLWACAAVYCAVRWRETVRADLVPAQVRETIGAGLVPAQVRETVGAGLVPAQARETVGAGLVPAQARATTRVAPTMWAFATGTLASLTLLFEQSKGAGLALGLVLGFAMLALLDRRRVRRYGAHWIALCGGFAWPFILTFAYFGTHHAMGALLTDWLWPLQHYSLANRVPYGHLDWSDQTREMLFHSGPWLARGLALFAVSPSFLLPALPIIAIILLVYWALEARKGRLASDRAAYYILICSTLAGLLVSVIVVRANTLHFVHLIPLLYLVLAWIMDGRDIRGSLMNSLKPLVTTGVLITFTAVGMAFLVTNRGTRLTVETRRGTVQIPAPDSVLEYTLAHVPAGSTILVYPYLPLYNYLTATFSPTRYEYLQPGMHTREQDAEAIREIASDRTPVVLFEPGFNEKIANAWPNTPLQFVANDPVGDYILAHYRSCRILNSAAGWRFLYMVRKDLACP